MATRKSPTPDSETTAPLTAGVIPRSGTPLANMLDAFKATQEIKGKGQIATMIYASRLARVRGQRGDERAPCLRAEAAGDERARIEEDGPLREGDRGRRAEGRSRRGHRPGV